MDFPITELLDDGACYAWLSQHLYPRGLRCPRCGDREMGVHRRRRAPVLDYRCRGCGAVFNLFTGTALAGTRLRPRVLALTLRGFAQGVTTARLARELKLNRPHLLALRHKLQAHARGGLDRAPLPDAHVEADEVYQQVGEKGVKHADPEDPPRRRAAVVRGPGTWDNDRPPVIGVVGRTSGRLRLQVAPAATEAHAVPAVRGTARPGAAVSTDESSAYRRLAWDGYAHSTVAHSRKEWARDDDGDGVREVHCNTLEGIWSGLRTALRPFRGVNKVYLAQYVAMFEWSYNIKAVTSDFIRALCGVKVRFTRCRT